MLVGDRWDMRWGKWTGLCYDFAICKEFELHSIGDRELLKNIWQLNDSPCSFLKDSSGGIREWWGNGESNTGSGRR